MNIKKIDESIQALEKQRDFILEEIRKREGEQSFDIIAKKADLVQVQSRIVVLTEEKLRIQEDAL